MMEKLNMFLYAPDSGLIIESTSLLWPEYIVSSSLPVPVCVRLRTGPGGAARRPPRHPERNQRNETGNGCRYIKNVHHEEGFLQSPPAAKDKARINK